jgi:esterase/lipase superfamily enzyme
MRDSNNDCIITLGVNSGMLGGVNELGYTPQQFNELENIFSEDGKRVMVAHSAGTEAQLKALLEAKQQGVPLPDKVIFASPRVSRDTFEWYLDEIGLSSDQVLVVTAAGDYPHWPTDVFSANSLASGSFGFAIDGITASFFDYENSSSNQYIYLKEDLASDQMLGHGGMIEGAIYDHEYIFVENGVEKIEELRTIYSDFINE